MFKQMEIEEQVYEEITPSEKLIRVYTNRDSHVSTQKEGESASPNNPNKGRARNRKTKHAGHPSNGLTGTKKYMLPACPWTLLRGV